MFVKFFDGLKGKYAPGTLWVIFSCLNSNFVEKYGISIKGLPRSKKCLKKQTSGYACTKADTFNADKMFEVLTKLQETDSPKSTLQAIAITLLDYRLLQSFKIRMIQVKDVILKDENGKKEILVNFLYQRQRINAGMEYNIPIIYFDLHKCFVSD